MTTAAGRMHPGSGKRRSGDPEPIEAEYEPLDDTSVRPARGAPRPMRSRNVTLAQVIIASSIAAALGAIVAIAVNNAGSGAPTGTLAREIDILREAQADFSARADQAVADVVALRASLDAQRDRLDRRDITDVQLRQDLAALTSQLSAISGASAGAAPDGAAPASSPLGVLLARINKLERIVADDRTAPRTTREVQRAIASLSDQVAALDRANTTLVTAFDQRQAALVALETGMQTLASDLDLVRAGQPAPRRGAVMVASVLAPDAMQSVFAATTRAQTIRALASLEAAARESTPFADAYDTLAGLLPGDASLVSIATIADTGAPALAQLRHDFDRAAIRARKLAERESDDGWNWMRQAFAGVVEFDPSQLVARNGETIRTARRQLDLGDVRGAIAAITTLPVNSNAAYESWLTRASARAQLDEALRDLNSRLLGAAGASAPPGQG